MRTLSALFFVYLLSTTSGAAQEARLNLLWETNPELSVPESVLVAENERIFVSNIAGMPTDKDGNGFISLLDPDGNILEMQWATGLNAPKGMAISGDALYVTDIDRIVKFSLGDGRFLKEIPVEGAEFLNDLATLPDGSLACTDMTTSRIHFFVNDSLVHTLTSPVIERPNGLWAWEDLLLIGTRDKVLRMQWELRELEGFFEGTGSVDGLIGLGPDAVIISDWAGKVTLLREAQPPQVLLDGTEKKVNAADLGWHAGRNMLLVPTFFDNRVKAYELLMK